MTTTSWPWQSPLPSKARPIRRSSPRQVAVIQAFRRNDFDGFAKRVASGEALKDAWRSANEGFEQLLFEAKRAALEFDRHFSVSRRLDLAARSAADRAREIDRELGIGRRWRTFSMDFGRNWPRVSESHSRLAFFYFLDIPLPFFLFFYLDLDVVVAVQERVEWISGNAIGQRFSCEYFTV